MSDPEKIGNCEKQHGIGWKIYFILLKKFFPNPKEVLNKLENEKTRVSAKDKYFFVVKK
ncbi:MAG: hypothetical protein ACOY3D_07825 [Candidatus Omnitrophota bacterium]